jgi:hypothetical protein
VTGLKRRGARIFVLPKTRISNIPNAVSQRKMSEVTGIVNVTMAAP